MSFTPRGRHRQRRTLKKSRSLLITMLVASLLGVASSTPAAEAQQPPTPERPLLLIGGTMVGVDNPGWLDIVEWFEAEGGYTRIQDLFVGEMERLPENPNWPWQGHAEWDWEDHIVPAIKSANFSTAGLAAMEDSVATLADQIDDRLDDAEATELDIIAHSQAAAIVRKYIREREENNESNPVVNLISLGGGNYGISTSSPEFRDFFGQYAGEFFGPLATFFGMAGCRDGNWIPVCPDIIREHGTILPSPVIPDPYNPDWSLYTTTFYPELNNISPTTVGPVPGDTFYWHFYSTIFDQGGDEEDYEQAGEVIPLFDQEPNVFNATIQGFCGASYHLHHNDEWDDPPMRELLIFALGVRLPDAGKCTS